MCANVFHSQTEFEPKLFAINSTGKCVSKLLNTQLSIIFLLIIIMNFIYAQCFCAICGSNGLLNECDSIDCPK